MLVKKYHDSHFSDKEVLIDTRKAIDSSSELRSKKALIETFISGINDVDDVSLYVLEHSDRQIVGNYLFSYWRYLTYWSMGWSEFDIDYLKRIIAILESAYEQEEHSEDKKRVELYLRQKKTLELFLERNTITKEQSDKSLGELTVKTGMKKHY